MLKRLLSLFIALNIFCISFPAELFARERTISETDVEVLLAQLPDDLQPEEGYPLGATAVSLLIGGYLYLVVDDYIFERRMLKKEEAIVKWLRHKMPSKERRRFVNSHFSDIKKYIIYKSQPKEVRRAFVDKIRSARYAKKGMGALLFVAAAIGIEYLVASNNEPPYQTPVSSDRVEIKRILTNTAHEHPEAFALSAYLMPYRKLVCSIISEDENLYKLLKEQVEFAISKENREFTGYLLKAAQEEEREEKEKSLKQDLKIGDEWFKNNWESKYNFSNFQTKPGYEQ